MRFKSFKIGKTNEKPEEETGEGETVMVNEVSDIEEKITNKTKKLKDAEKQALVLVSKDGKHPLKQALFLEDLIFVKLGQLYLHLLILSSLKS